MTLLERFKIADDAGSEPMLRDRSTILAYLEELIRLGSVVQFWLHKDDLAPLGGKLEVLHEEDRAFSVLLQRALPGELGANASLAMVFALDGMRFEAPVHFVTREGYLRARFQVPEQVGHAERRAKMRTRFGPREKATCTVLEGFFEGKGATGRLVNLSMEGACLRIERAISIADNRKLGIHPALFLPRHPLAMVRIQNLPHIPTIECCGTVCHTGSTSIGVLMGISLEGLGGLEQQHLRQVLARRLPTFARGFPVRHRRCEMELPPEPEEAWEPAEETGPGEILAQDSQVEELEAARPDTHVRLLQMKKRGKRILILIRDDLDRAIMAGTLQVDGFRQIMEAHSMIDVLRFCRSTPPDLMIIEQQLGTANAQEILDRLKKHGDCVAIPVVMIADTRDVRTAIMAKAAGFSHVMGRPVDYDGEMKGVLYRLLDLN